MGADKKFISIRVVDQTSGLNYLDISVDVAAFTDALLFDSYQVSCEVELRETCVPNLGKKVFSEDFSATFHMDELKDVGLDTDKLWKQTDETDAAMASLLQKRLDAIMPGIGWVAGSYFGSKGSVISDYTHRKVTLKTRIYRYEA